ncbi:hypothetical protein COO60DRAFT_16939 [Scenedesmus sp. NREL 46B-D3]|nr:hypothetical protein COO60DRAFT_16939 [Scenedesmus sp. NREL 46B-D3]
MRCTTELCVVLALMALGGALLPAATAGTAWQKQQQQRQVYQQRHALLGGRHMHNVHADSRLFVSQELPSRRRDAHGGRLRQARTLLQANAQADTQGSGSSSSSNTATLPSGGLLPGLAGTFSVNLDLNAGQPTAAGDASRKEIQVQVRPAASPAPSTSNTNASGSSRATQPPTTSSSSRPRRSSSSLPSNSSSSRSTSPQQLQNTSAAAAAAAPQQAGELCSSPNPPSSSNIDYTYMRPDGHQGNPLGLPVLDPPGLPWMSRWVMCAWSVSNFSSPSMLSDAAMRQVQGLVNNFSAMAPGQIQLAAAANITLSFAFQGLAADWSEAASSALRSAASGMAGGYDPALITVSTAAPQYGVPTQEFEASEPARVTRLPHNNLTVGGGPAQRGSGSGRRAHARRLLQLSSSSSSSSGRGVGPGSRFLLQATGGSGSGSRSTGPWGADVPGSSAAAPGWTKVWLSYTRLLPSNTSSLLCALAASCGAAMQGPARLSGAPCGQAVRQALLGAGMLGVDGSSYEQWMTDDPMVSLGIRLAVGITPSQQEAGTDAVLGGWLANPANVYAGIRASGLPDPVGPHALIKWMLRPQIWDAPPGPPEEGEEGGAPAGLAPGAIAGIAVGSAAAAVLAGGLLLLLVRHRRRAADEEAKDEHGSVASGARRRRRREGKRRYLAPQPPTDSPTAAAAAAAAGGAAAGTSAAAAADAEDDPLDPDQIRPAMRELGDSVTSAVRFEVEDDDEQQQGPGAAAAAASTGAGGGGAAGAAHSTSRRVLAARGALVAEHRQQQQQGPTAAAPAAAAGAVLPLLPSSSSGGEPDLVSSRGGWVPGSTSPAAAAGLSAAARPAAAPAASMEQHMQQHTGLAGPTTPAKPSPLAVSLPGAAAFSPAVSAAAASAVLPGSAAAAAGRVSPGLLGPATPAALDFAALGIGSCSGSGSPAAPPCSKVKASPFALAYDFGGLAAAAPEPAGAGPAGGAAGAAASSRASTGSLGITSSARIALAGDGSFKALHDSRSGEQQQQQEQHHITGGAAGSSSGPFELQQSHASGSPQFAGYGGIYSSGSDSSCGAPSMHSSGSYPSHPSLNSSAAAGGAPCSSSSVLTVGSPVAAAKAGGSAGSSSSAFVPGRGGGVPTQQQPLQQQY